jgi:hypothetical protein
MNELERCQIKDVMLYFDAWFFRNAEFQEAATHMP